MRDRVIYIFGILIFGLLISRIHSLSLARLADELCRREPSRSYCKEINAAEAEEKAAAVRRAPVDFANLAAANSGGGTPLAFGRSTGNTADFEVPGLGSLGVGQSISDVAKFIPPGVTDSAAVPNSGTFNIGDTKYGFTQKETGTGQTRQRMEYLNLGGVGKFEVGKKAEQGAGIANFLDSFIPKIPDPPGGIDNPRPASDANDDTSEAAPSSNYYSNAYSGNSEKYKELIREFEKKSSNKAFGAKTAPPQEKDVFKDDEGFIEQEAFEEDKLQPQHMTIQELQAGHVPLSQLGLKKEQIQALCQKFSVIAAQVCYGTKIEPQFLDKCRGYSTDCAGYISEAKPLGAVANAFNSGVGITYFNVGVNGIPYYAVNEEGAVDAGHNGKVDFGSWGGGYSDTIGVRDYWKQTGEAGANWYEGLYGYKTGWHVPIASQLGVEGGGGTHVHIPLKEGSFGQPIQVSNGYHVGPYVGLAENVGVDWYNGGVSSSRGFALPIVGVNGNAGTSVGFPSLGTVMKAMGLPNAQFG